MASSDLMDKLKVENYALALSEAARETGRDERDREARARFAGTLDELRGLVGQVVREGDEHLIPRVAERYRELAEQDVEVVAVDVTTAIPLDDELRAKVAAYLKRRLKAPVYMVEHVDPSIIGGIVFGASGKVRDASVRYRLELAHASLSSPSDAFAC